MCHAFRDAHADAGVYCRRCHGAGGAGKGGCAAIAGTIQRRQAPESPQLLPATIGSGDIVCHCAASHCGADARVFQELPLLRTLPCNIGLRSCPNLTHSAAQSPCLTSSCTAGIRLAGATNDVHIMDVRSGRWEKVTPLGEPPSPRAAHAAAAVGNMVVVQVRTCVGHLMHRLRCW